MLDSLLHQYECMNLCHYYSYQVQLHYFRCLCWPNQIQIWTDIFFFILQGLYAHCTCSLSWNKGNTDLVHSFSFSLCLVWFSLCSDFYFVGQCPVCRVKVPCCKECVFEPLLKKAMPRQPWVVYDLINAWKWDKRWRNKEESHDSWMYDNV